MRSPVPNSTSVPELQRTARAREVHERFAIALRALGAGRSVQAVAEFERIRALHPGEPAESTAAYDSGIAYAQLHRLDDAARAFHDAIAGDPEFLAAYANAISVEIQRSNIAEARRLADHFVSIAPDSARALYARGIVALRAGDPATAASDFGKLLQRNPSYAVAHYDLGVAQAKLGQFAQAEREFTQAVTLEPSYVRARFALATVLLHEGKRSEARAALDLTLRDAGSDIALRTVASALRNTLH